MVIFFGNRILCPKPQILFGIQRIIETCPCKTLNRCICIMYPLQDACPLKLMNRFLHHGTIFCRKDKFSLSGFRHFDFHIFINIPICMAGNGNRFLPISDTRFDSLHNDRRTEYGSVQYGTDCSVRAFPHFLQMIFRHPGSIRGNRGTFYGNTILFCCLCRIYRHFIIRFIAVFQSEVIILRF